MLSREPGAHASGVGALNHLGIRLPLGSDLGAWQRRLQTAGFAVQQMEEVECCYARQTKLLVQDPDRNLWEVYTLEEDTEQHGFSIACCDTSPRQLPSLDVVSIAATAQENQPAPAASLWARRLGEPLPARVFALDNTVDEAQLQGTFNAAHSAEQRRQLLNELMRCLKPGGKIHLHVLTASGIVDREKIDLPGPAAAVKQVPHLDELHSALHSAGFVQQRLTKYGAAPCFEIEGVELRETMLEAYKPAAEQSGAVRVLYLGPFAQLTTDDGDLISISLPRVHAVG